MAAFKTLMNQGCIFFATESLISIDVCTLTPGNGPWFRLNQITYQPINVCALPVPDAATWYIV